MQTATQKHTNPSSRRSRWSRFSCCSWWSLKNMKKLLYEQSLHCMTASFMFIIQRMSLCMMEKRGAHRFPRVSCVSFRPGKTVHTLMTKEQLVGRGKLHCFYTRRCFYDAIPEFIYYIYYYLFICTGSPMLIQLRHIKEE